MPCKSVLIRVKPVSVSQCQKSPCQLVSMLIHRLPQPARSKEQGNSFAGGQGADLHSPCTPGRERTATSTPSRLTFALFAVNKICVNLRNLRLKKAGKFLVLGQKADLSTTPSGGPIRV